MSRPPFLQTHLGCTIPIHVPFALMRAARLFTRLPPAALFDRHTLTLHLPLLGCDSVLRTALGCNMPIHVSIALMCTAGPLTRLSLGALFYFRFRLRLPLPLPLRLLSLPGLFCLFIFNLRHIVVRYPGVARWIGFEKKGMSDGGVLLTLQPELQQRPFLW